MCIVGIMCHEVFLALAAFHVYLQGMYYSLDSYLNCSTFLAGRHEMQPVQETLHDT